MSGKINVSVCRGHELANALFFHATLLRKILMFLISLQRMLSPFPPLIK